MISGDIGPTIFSPFFFKNSTAGIISLISSDPKIPFSPAWGFNPHTAILGSVLLILVRNCLRFLKSLNLEMKKVLPLSL